MGMTPTEKARVLKRLASEYMQSGTDLWSFPADEVLELLTERELHEVAMALDDGAMKVAHYLDQFEARK
jgi:hypothetical protein